MTSRDITKLKAELQPLAIEFLNRCNKAICPLEAKIIQTTRTLAEQTAYFAQGRKPLDEVNRLRADAGLDFITSAQNAHTITDTIKKSKHLLGEAFDIGIFSGGEYLTDEVYDQYYLTCAGIGRDLGLVCGAFWTHPDIPHYELPEEAENG